MAIPTSPPHLVRLRKSIDSTLPFMTALLTIPFFGASDLSAQTSEAYSCRIWFGKVENSAMPKPWLTSLSDGYGTTSIGMEEDGCTIWFDTDERVILNELEDRASAVGYTVFGYTCVNNMDDSTFAEGVPPMPVHVSTGDETGDHARYAAAKAQWINAHPRAYAYVTDPEQIGTPHVK